MSDPSDPASYVAAVVTLYVELPETPLRASVSDQWLARRFHDDGVPLHVVETALLLGSLRRLIRPADAPRLSPIRSLAYFRPVIDELRAHPAPESYLDYLRLKLRQAAAALPANVQKSTFSDDRLAQDGTLTEIHRACIKPLMTWKCPQCHRTFRQVNQRHACGVGNAATLLKDRPPELVGLYRKLEATINGFGVVEVVTRNRYALFRTTRIFTDLTVMRDALRVVIHLGRKVSAPYFVKIGEGDKRVSHVAVVRTDEDLRTIKPFLREAFNLAAGEES